MLNDRAASGNNDRQYLRPPLSPLQTPAAARKFELLQHCTHFLFQFIFPFCRSARYFLMLHVAGGYPQQKAEICSA